MEPEEIFQVPVPRSKLAAVYAVLGSAEQVGERPPAIDGFWTQEKVARLRRELGNHVTRTALDLCAARPGEEVSIREIEQEAGVDMPKVRAALAGLTMLIKHRFGASGWQDWPITWSYRAGIACYRMSPRLAAWWKGEGTDVPGTG